MAWITRTNSEYKTQELAQKLAEKFKAGTVIALHGALGVGKSVFVRGIARGLGIEEAVTSPSFTIVSEYEAEIPLVHIDLYRTESNEELELLGFDELISRPAVLAIEWADKCVDFLPDNYIRVDIVIEGDARKISIDGIEYERPDD